MEGAELLIESRWPPITTTSAGRLVPVMVAITEGWAQVGWVNSSTVTSLRPTAYFSQTALSWLAAFTPPAVV